MSARPYSLARDLLALAERRPLPSQPQLTKDDDAALLHFASYSPAMLGDPFPVRAGIDSLTTSTGGVFKFTQPGDVFAAALARTEAARRMTQRTVTSLLAQSILVNTGATANWVAENSGSDNTPTTPTGTAVSIALKTLQASTSFSRQMLFSAKSGDVDIEQQIRDDLAAVFAVAIDLAAVNGLGSASNQPLGLLQNTAISTVTMGANGGTLDYATACSLELAVENANAPTGSRAFVTTPSVQSKARQTAAISNSVPLWSDRDTMLGYPAAASTNVPANLTKGTTTGCSALVFGAWEDAILASAPYTWWLVDPYSLKNQNMIAIMLTSFVDIAVVRATSFRRVLDIIGN